MITVQFKDGSIINFDTNEKPTIRDGFIWFGKEIAIASADVKFLGAKNLVNFPEKK